MLNLSSNRAGVKTMRLISELFRTNDENFTPTLEELDLSETPLSTEACFVLASGLTQ